MFSNIIHYITLNELLDNLEKCIVTDWDDDEYPYPRLVLD
jgi:hypothetical protein